MPPFPGDISYKIKLVKVNCIWNVKLFKITRVVLKYLKGRVRIISLSTLQGWTSVVKNESYWLRKGKLRISNKGSWSQEINHCNGAAAWPDSYSHLKSLPLVDSSFTATRLVMWINLKNWKKQPFRFWVLTDHCLVQSSNHIWTFHIPHSHSQEVYLGPLQSPACFHHYDWFHSNFFRAHSYFLYYCGFWKETAPATVSIKQTFVFFQKKFQGEKKMHNRYLFSWSENYSPTRCSV